FLIIPFFAFAAEEEGIISAKSLGEGCYKYGNCDFGSVMGFGVYIGQLTLKYIGLVIFVVFVYGGILWIFSAGDPTKVAKGKKAIQASLIGLIITFSAYFLVANILKILNVDTKYANVLPNEGGIGGGDVGGCPLQASWGPCGSSNWTANCDGGRDIEAFQTNLGLLNCGSIAADGKYGCQTDAASQRFKQNILSKSGDIIIKWPSFEGPFNQTIGALQSKPGTKPEVAGLLGFIVVSNQTSTVPELNCP
ncbi:MAG: hypothetical protein HYW78_02215, partial [Parcubacteria group bacterium]|nr:hypothetical protein [Parcubacteria group bacterium]